MYNPFVNGRSEEIDNFPEFPNFSSENENNNKSHNKNGNGNENESNWDVIAGDLARDDNDDDIPKTDFSINLDIDSSNDSDQDTTCKKLEKRKCSDFFKTHQFTKTPMKIIRLEKKPRLDLTNFDSCEDGENENDSSIGMDEIYSKFMSPTIKTEDKCIQTDGIIVPTKRKNTFKLIIEEELDFDLDFKSKDVSNNNLISSSEEYGHNKNRNKENENKNKNKGKAIRKNPEYNSKMEEDVFVFSPIRSTTIKRT